MQSKEEKLDTTIKIVANVLEKNKNKPELKEAYEDIQKLKEKRNIN